MPRETVYADAYAPPNAAGGTTVVEVTWSREASHVQLVSKAVDELGGRVAGEDPGIHYTDGMYATLSRTNINDLIRHLRRARDQAFGRDE